MNIALLSDIKANILAVPESFRMESWFTRDDDAPCGTAGCIAGHALAIHESAKTLKEAAYSAHRRDLSISYQAAEILGLKQDQRWRLFDTFHWPTEFCRRYDSATNPLERAQATADRIDRFIATEGAE